MKYSLIFVVFALSALAVLSLPDPVYTIHYVKSYRRDWLDKNFGCGKSIVFGTYLYPLGPVDALYGVINPQQLGLPGCSRPATYVKLFGDAQDYSKILNIDGQIIRKIGQTLDRVRGQTIIDWKYMPEDQDERYLAFQSLKKIAETLEEKGHKPIIKAPASYFCAGVKGHKFILDQPAQKFIIELYGEEPGKYTTYESIFGQKAEAINGNGYSEDCPKYPTRPILNKLALGRTISFEKTLDSTQPGFIGPHFQKFLEQAGSSEANNIYFLDGYPHQTVDL